MPPLPLLAAVAVVSPAAPPAVDRWCGRTRRTGNPPRRSRSTSRRPRGRRLGGRGSDPRAPCVWRPHTPRHTALQSRRPWGSRWTTAASTGRRRARWVWAPPLPQAATRPRLICEPRGGQCPVASARRCRARPTSPRCPGSAVRRLAVGNAMTMVAMWVARRGPGHGSGLGQPLARATRECTS